MPTAHLSIVTYNDNYGPDFLMADKRQEWRCNSFRDEAGRLTEFNGCSIAQDNKKPVKLCKNRFGFDSDLYMADTIRNDRLGSFHDEADYATAVKLSKARQQIGIAWLRSAARIGAGTTVSSQPSLYRTETPPLQPKQQTISRFDRTG